MDLCWQSDICAFFNMPSRFVIAFLPRSKHLLISWLQSPSAVILELKKIKSTFPASTFPLSIRHEVMGPDAMILVFWMLSFKPAFSLSSFTFIKKNFSSSSLSAIRVVSFAYLRLAILIPACDSSSLAFHVMYSAYKLNKQGDNMQSCLSYSFPYLEAAHCSMSGSNGCFLTHTQVSQETGKVVWYSRLFKNFLQFVVIHTVKSFSIVNEAELDVFLELACFLHDPMNVGNLISVSSASLKPSLSIWIFSVQLLQLLLKLSLKNLEHNLASMWDERTCTVVWTFWTLPFFGIGMKTDLFQSCGHCWVFQICWHIECSTFTASSFGILNSSAVIPSLLQALFVIMLPKAHLTSHSRMSGSRWVTTPS